MNGLSQVYSKCSLFHKEPYTKHFWTLVAFFSLEAYLASLYFILLPFSVIAFFFLKQMEGLWQPCIEQIFWCRFPNSICSLACLCVTFANSHSISDFFMITIFVMVIRDQ